ncbi:MAG TPA: phosphate ABC transporter permease PstA [Firmicutes bacterium]|nr:phosphate ABC transporter permease PstA [Bacillota bacterium]
MKSKRDPLSTFLLTVVHAAAAIAIFIVVAIVIYVVVNGVPNLSPELFSFTYNSDNQSMFPSLINTLLMVALALVMAGPIGILAAIFLVEYAASGSKLVRVIRLTTETLSGIPSIIFGLFGRICFVVVLGMGLSLISGACTVALMILPLVIRTTEEALISVPKSYREGSYGLGAGKLRTVFRIVLPSALPGIFAGVILAVGRIVGETAAIIYTAGSIAEIPSSIFDSTRTLAVHMYVLSNEGLYIDKTYATAFILLLLVLALNALSTFVAKKLTKGAGEK